MHTYKKNAVIVGILFLVALILNLIATEIFNPVLNRPDYLAYAYPSGDAIITGNLLNFICAISIIFIPIVLFPVAQKYDKSLAQIYIVFRALEGILFMYMVIQSLTFISLSKAYINADSQTAVCLQVLGNSIHSNSHWATVIDVIVFTLGALSFYYLLYKSKLVPRFLSIWGFWAALYLFAGAVLGMFTIGIFSHMPFMKGMIYFAPPIALNEFILGIWLIIKGFNLSIPDSGSIEIN